MAKLSSFNRERLAVGFEEEFLSLKHLNSPSEEGHRGVFHRKYVGCCLCRISYRDWRGSGGTVYVGRKRSLNMGGGRMQLAIGSQGWQDLKAVLLCS